MSFAQTYDTIGFKSESESRYEYIAAKFAKEYREKLETWSSIVERRFIQEGDSTRIFFFFNPSYVQRIDIEGGPVVVSKNITRDIWYAIVKPQKSTSYKIRVVRNVGSASATTLPSYNIVVVDADKFKEADAKVKELANTNNGKGVLKYIEELDPAFQKRTSLPIYNGVF